MNEEKLLANIQNIQNQIDEHIQDNQIVNLIAVTKYVDSNTIRQLYEIGLRDFAENRSDALLQKQEELSDITENIRWHFIGQLQRRPVRKIINKIAYLHSVDRLSLIHEINKRAEHTIRIFLQVNISGESQKAGFTPTELLEIIHEIENYPKIQVVGLMTMAPYDAQEEELRTVFRTLKQLQVKVQDLNLPYAPCERLSMGMSQDFPIAIQEGSTDIRIGQALYDENEVKGQNNG